MSLLYVYSTIILFGSPPAVVECIPHLSGVALTPPATGVDLVVVVSWILAEIMLGVVESVLVGIGVKGVELSSLGSSSNETLPRALEADEAGGSGGGLGGLAGAALGGMLVHRETSYGSSLQYT